MAHKGNTTSDVTYNPEDGPEAYNNPVVHNSLSEYTAMAKEVHWLDYDPSTEDIDGDVLMRVGGGKRHGRYWIADGAIDSSFTPTLSQVRAARAQPYDLDRTTHIIGYSKSWSLLIYSSFIDYYIPW
jgi:hypothetical protein